MNILQIYSGQNSETGDYIYRIERPAQQLSKIGRRQVINLDLLDFNDEAMVVEADIVILHHLTDPDFLPLVSKRRKLNRPTIYELADNFHASQDHKSETRKNGLPEYHVIIEEFLRRCDVVQTTCTKLRERYEYLNRNFIIFPNIIGEVKRRSGYNDSGSLTIGWGGSARHANDLASIADIVIDWVAQNSDVKLAIMGGKTIQGLFDRMPREQIQLYHPGSLKRYLTFLDRLDIGVAPLLPTEFNACRSDVKFLEFASREVVPICSRFGPYEDIAHEGESILLFDDPPGLIDHLDTLKRQPRLRRKIAKQARIWVEENRLDHPRHWNARLHSYKKLLKGTNHNTNFGFANCRNQRADIGKNLKEGITCSDLRASIRILEKAVSLYSEHYQAYYFYGWALFRAGQKHGAIAALKQALSLRPDSIRTAQLLTRVLLISGQYETAASILEKALKIEPRLSTLLADTARILQLQNRHREAVDILRSCVRKSPKLVEAWVALAHSTIALKRFREARGCAEQLRQIVPKSPDLSSILQLLAQKGKSRKAADALFRVS